VTRLDRSLRKSPGEKSLGQTIGNARRDMNPFTARDADRDLVVLEGIPTVNLGRGVPDPTPGGAAAMSGPNRHWRVSEEKNPSDIRNPDGHFPREFGPMWKNFNFTALNVAPRTRRGTSPASVNTYLHVEWTEPHWDAVRDDTGIWNPPPPPEMEVERAIYDAMKRETIEVGGYNVPFPKYPKESDYGQYTDPKGATIPYLRAPRSFPFSNRENSRWTDGDPLYHAAPTGLLPKIIAEGLVTGADRQLWFGASPTVWNEQFPGNAADRLKSPVKGMSFLRISPTDAMNERLSLLAKVGDVDRPTLYLAIDSAGNLIEPRDYRTQRAVGLYGDAIYFDDIKIPGENIEVLSQSGEWIPLYKTDLSEVVFDPSGGAEAGMSNEKNRGVRRLLAKLTNNRFGEDGRDDAPTGRPEPSPREDALTVSVSPVPQSRIRYSDSYGGDDLIKDEQRIERMKHEALVASGSWNKIHSDHYDWWAYPIDRGSASYGETFNVAGEPIERLKKDPEFLASLAREIEIQALALGWSLYDQDWVESLDWENGQDWRRAYPTRFWKATRSAQIFGLEDEFESLLVLKGSLEDAGIAFGREDYWRNPGTIDDVPSLGPSWEERRQTPRFGASDATGQYSLFPTESRFDRRGAASGPTSPEVTRRRPETGDDLFADRPEEWPGLAYDSDDSSMQVVYGVVIAAEELADLLFESDRTMEFGYPYERIDEDTRSMMAEDIFFATGLLDDDQLVSDFDVDRQESAAKMREYARAIWDSVGYADDAETLEELAEALEDPTILEDDLIYQPTDPDPGAEAGMAGKSSLTNEVKDRVTTLYNEGKTREEIAKELDLSVTKVGYILKRLFAGGLAKSRLASPERARELTVLAATMYNEGKRTREIVEELGISSERAENYLGIARKLGLLTTSKNRTSAEVRELMSEAARLYNEGKPRMDIAKEMNLDDGYVSSLLHQANKLNLIRDYNPKQFGKFGKTVRTPKNFAAVADKRRQGKTVAQIAEELGINEGTANSLVFEARRMGLDTGPRRHRTSSELDELMLEMAIKYEEGKPMREIAQEMGVDTIEVNKLAQRAAKLGLIRRERLGDATDELMGEVMARLGEGKTIEEIAQEMNFSPRKVNDLVRRARLVNAPESPADPGAPGVEAGMGRRFRGLDEEPDYSEMGLGDAEIQDFIESEFDLAGEDKIFGRSRSFLADLDQGSFVAGKPKEVYQLSIGAPENIPDQTKEDYKELWNAGVGWREINRRLGISNEDGALVQSELLRTGVISRRSAPEGTSFSWTQEVRPFTAAEERFAELLLASTPKTQIMDELGLSEREYRNVARFLYQRGISRGVGPAGRPRRELSDIEKEFVRLYGKGKTMPQIMAELGLSRGQYINRYQFLRRRGLVNPRRDIVNPSSPEAGMVGGPRNSAAREELIKTFAEMYNNQVSKAEIMRRMGLTADDYESLYNAISSRRLRMPSARRDARLDPRLTESAEIFAEMYNGGASKTEIMREMDLTPNQYKRLFSASQTRALIGGRRERKLTEALGGEAGMSSALVRKVTDDDAQLGLIYAVPGVRASVVMRNTEGLPTVPGRNAIMKPYLLAPHVSLDRLAPDNPAIRSLAPALGRAGLGSYPVEGHRVPKIQGPVVRDFADELIGPKAVADAISGTFPTADELLTAYAVNALIRARAEYLSDSTLTADQVNTAIMNGQQIGTSRDGGADAGGTFWTPPDGRRSGLIFQMGEDKYPIFTSTLDPFMSFKGRSEFLWFVIDAMPETVKSELAPYLTKKPNLASWNDVSDFENINIREDDDLSRRFAPMVRAQARVVVEHARRHMDLTQKWARIAYETMRGSGLSDAEVAFVINEHWTKAAEFSLDDVGPGKVLASAARVGAKAFSSRYSPITKLDGIGEEEDYGLHEFFHHYLGQGFTRHGEYVAFRGPADLIDSYHGHLQWAFNQNSQLGMFATKVLLEGLGADTKNKASKLNNYSSELFESVARAIYDRLREMLASPDARARLLGQVFPEFVGATTADEARIMELIRKQFERRSLRSDVFLMDYVPAMRLMTAHDFLVPREYWPYGGDSSILFWEDA